MKKKLKLVFLLVISFLFLCLLGSFSRFQFYDDKYRNYSNKAALSSLVKNCNNTFIVNNGGVNSLYEYEIKDNKFLINKLDENTPAGLISQSIYDCKRNIILSTVNRRGMPEFKHSFGFHLYYGNKEEFIPFFDGPCDFEFYNGYLLVETNLVKSDLFNKKLGDVLPYFLFEDEGKLYEGYESMLLYDLDKREIIKDYKFGISAYLKIIDDMAYIVRSGGQYFTLNLKTGYRNFISSINGHMRLEQFSAINNKMFMMTFYFTQIETKAFKKNTLYEIIGDKKEYSEKPYEVIPKELDYYKDGYKYADDVEGLFKEILTTDEPDPKYMLTDNGFVYIFTRNSGKVIRYNVKTKKIKKFNFPFKNIEVVNYTKDAFLIGLNSPMKKNNEKINIIITNKDFNNFTSIYDSKIEYVDAITTQFNFSGGHNNL